MFLLQTIGAPTCTSPVMKEKQAEVGKVGVRMPSCSANVSKYVRSNVRRISQSTYTRQLNNGTDGAHYQLGSFAQCIHMRAYARGNWRSFALI